MKPRKPTPDHRHVVARHVQEGLVKLLKAIRNLGCRGLLDSRKRLDASSSSAPGPSKATWA